MHPLAVRAARGIRVVMPLVLGAATVSPRLPARQRAVAAMGLATVWGITYSRYRQRSLEFTSHDYELMATATPEAYSRHYNEHVPTVAEELDLWGEYHGHRHKMRYRLVADMVMRHATGDRVDVLDVGCGAALVADHLVTQHWRYVGLEFGDHHVKQAAQRFASSDGRALRTYFARGDATALPFADATFDVVVMSEVIEHLMRPELAVWEIARVLRPGGTFVMTTNNASEMPLRFPLSDPLAFLEKAVGFNWDGLISHRPWVWPEQVSRELLPADAPNVWVPHTWHKQAETRRMFDAAGLSTVHASTFEFPPPQSRTAAWLESHGSAGRRVVDVLEAVATATPLVNRLGCHLLMVAKRRSGPLPLRPSAIWPGPFSADVP